MDRSADPCFWIVVDRSADPCFLVQPEGELRIMSTALKRISVQEYLTRERAATFKSEYFEGEIFAMAGGTPQHSLIAANFIREAGNALKGKTLCSF